MSATQQLMAVFDFDEPDLQANRQHRQSTSQRKDMFQRGLTLFPILESILLTLCVIYAAVTDVTFGESFRLFLYISLWILAYMGVSLLIRWNVHTVKGHAELRLGESVARKFLLDVDATTFAITRQVYHALKDSDVPQMIVYFRGKGPTKEILSAEVAHD